MNKIHQIMTHAARLITLWKSGLCDTAAHARLNELLETAGPLYGRAIHGMREEDFARLSTMEAR